MVYANYSTIKEVSMTEVSLTTIVSNYANKLDFLGEDGIVSLHKLQGQRVSCSTQEQEKAFW